MKHLISTAVLLLSLFAAGRAVAQQDTLRLSHSEFLAIVERYHPLAFRYRLQTDIADAEILRARGNFDPVLEGKTGAKTIDGVDYYQESNLGVGIPTWYGVEFNGSYNYIDGQKINNSDTRGGLYQFGVTLPLARNLLYDKRRAALDQARSGLQMTLAEQQLLTNQLLLDAELAYWDWVRNYEVYRLQRRAVNINQERFDLTRKTFDFGEQAAIDTTEALSQLQNFELQMQDAYLKFLKSTQELSLFLWRDDQQPFDIEQLIVPSDGILDADAYDEFGTLISRLEQRTMSEHAAVEFYFQKNDLLESERRLKRQYLLPKIDLTYNFFNKENYRSDYFPLFQNNYQYGLKLGVPLFLRQERAELRIAKAKLEQNRLDIDYKMQELRAKMTAYKNEVLGYRTQIDIASANIGNYKRLLEAEEMKLGNGESSLFLINSRENKLLEAEQKLLELRQKFINSYNQLKWMNANFERISR